MNFHLKKLSAGPVFFALILTQTCPLGATSQHASDTLRKRTDDLIRSGNFAEVQSLLNQIFIDDEKTLGSTNPGIVTDLYDLLVCYRAQGKIEEAKTAEQGLRTILDRSLAQMSQQKGELKGRTEPSELSAVIQGATGGPTNAESSQHDLFFKILDYAFELERTGHKDDADYVRERRDQLNDLYREGTVHATPLAAKQGCPEDLISLAFELSHEFKDDPNNPHLTCGNLQRAVTLMPIKRLSKGQWRFVGEEDLRSELSRRFKIDISSSIMPFGFLERESPEKVHTVIVFGSTERPSSFLNTLVSNPQFTSVKQVARDVESGWGDYDTAGFYVGNKDNVFLSTGTWMGIVCDSWGKKYLSSPPEPYRACLPCHGWLCTDEPVACFSNLRSGNNEEIHFPRHSTTFPGTMVLQTDSSGKVTELFNKDQVAGTWQKFRGEWVFLSDVNCESNEFCGGLGNDACDRGAVYHFSRQTGRLEEEPSLIDQYRPVEVRQAPPGCAVDDPAGVLVYTNNGKWVRYISRKQPTPLVDN